MSAHVSSLTFEAYLRLHAALTAGSPDGAVRAVSAIEEPYFAVRDLRQVLLVHGLTAGKFARGDMLRAMVGAALVDPTHAAPAEAGGDDGPRPPAASAAAPAAAEAPPPPPPPLQASDLIALGWAEGPVDALQAALKFAPPLLLPRLPTATAGTADGGSRGVDAPGNSTPAAPPASETAAQPAAAAAHAAAEPAATGGWEAALAPPSVGAVERAPNQPVPPPVPPALDMAGQLDQRALLALLERHGLLPANTATGSGALQLGPTAPTTADSPLQPQQPGGASQLRGEQAAIPPPPPPLQQQQQQFPESEPPVEHPHTPWLRGQLAVFASLPGCRAAASEQLDEPAAAALAGRRVAFVLPQEMEVDAGRGSVLRLPAGVFQGRAIRFLGTVCRPALCETTCPGGHFFYSAKIIPPPHDALEAMAAAAAAACASAAGGAAQSEAGPSEAAARAAPTARDYAVALRQRIELELDLHPRLCAGEAGQLLLLDAEALQDAWVLLEREEPLEEGDDGGGGGGGGRHAAQGAGGQAGPEAAPRSRGRPAAKRSRRV